MPLRIDGDPSKNQLHVNDEFMKKSNGVIHLKNTGNVVVIDTARPSNNFNIHLYGGARFELHANAQILHFFLFLLDHSQVIIGENTYVNGNCRLQSHERAVISIGKNCLIGGGDFQCMTSDMHSIIDVETKDRINPPGDIVLEDEVWVGFDVTLFKTTRIGKGSVIAARSSVSGAFPPQLPYTWLPCEARPQRRQLGKRTTASTKRAIARPYFSIKYYYITDRERTQAFSEGVVDL